MSRKPSGAALLALLAVVAPAGADETGTVLADGAGVERARAVCVNCPVAAQCLEYALALHIDHGVWGGCSERERRRIAKRRRLEAERRAS